MVVEELFKARWVEKRASYSLFIGVLFTIISFLTSFLIFRNTPDFIGVSTMLFIVVLAVPVVNKLFDLEERIEIKEGLSFFRKHEHIIDFFIYFFIGIFIVLFIIALIKPNMVFSIEKLYNLESSVVLESRRMPAPPQISPGNTDVMLVFKNNLYVMLISFVLSLFYGAGAFFLITLNASVFASALAKVVITSNPGSGFISVSAFALCNLGILFLHAIPEVFGYLLASISGGVLSHAFIREKISGKNFKIVLKDSIFVMLTAILVLLLASIIENNLSKNLFSSNLCAKNQSIVITALIIILILFVAFEILRMKKVFHK